MDVVCLEGLIKPFEIPQNHRASPLAPYSWGGGVPYHLKNAYSIKCPRNVSDRGNQVKSKGQYGDLISVFKAEK